jgi:hypothetical protein
MDKTITTALFIGISMIMALTLFNIAYPAIVQGGDAITSMASRTENRMDTQISVIHATTELDSSGWWQDTNANSVFEAFVWVKNVGDARIIGIDNLDVFFGPESNFTRIPHDSQAGGVYPYWSWQVEGGGDWTPTSTLKISIHYSGALASGRYFAKVITPTGISADYFLGV